MIRRPAKRRQPPKAAGSPLRRGSRARPGLGLATGQAARYCLVSADTIANWITTGRLRAQRTAGGQFRIRCEDLRAFMVAHGMRTDLLNCETGHEPTCWEFWAARAADAGEQGARESVCLDCAVRRAGAAVCHAVRPLLPGGTLRAAGCVECAYLITRAAPIDDDDEERG